MLVSTPLELLPCILTTLRASFDSGITRPIRWRKQQLRNLWRMLDENEERIRAVLTADIGKPVVQTQVLEIILVKNDIVDMIKNLDDWLASKSVAVPTPFENWSPVISRQPKGVCLAIGAWNYPITLTLLPFVGIIACGNTGILKPSEHSPATAMLLAELFPKYLDPKCFALVNGDATASQALLKETFGHIMYTGGAEVAKLVMAAAAKTLTPITLELGGRNSAVVTGKADVAIAAKRIAWGKYASAGQTCFAPNQALVQDDVVEEFVEELKKVNEEFFQGKTDAEKVGKIVNKVHWQRIKDLALNTKGQIIFGGNDNADERFIQPMAVLNVTENDVLVQTEIFGPILPILTFKITEDAKRLMKELSPAPLALYIFTKDNDEIESYLSDVPAGTVAINDTLGQIAPASLPFGGIGTSGFGGYRGKASIETFSHARSEVNVSTGKDFEAMLDWRYPENAGMETVAFVKQNLEYPLGDW